ncbi:hypothetical protein HPC49_36545 [Pyxidicoccus fallax]|uniref:Uncharacterized protein n=1 Tax=Pyxidicoccus fallax TaxID=394095 RepID=A0A848LWX6_9BACT|nr:hypothetical protein [Pyxidicoccus fallax]NMO22139.1 hypothetical protein [Pyxidicoccus fallax]NPC83716.1 hypothetical protein [Pyxidicoccus fallax]
MGSNNVSVTFTNSLDSEFTLGKLNDGFAVTTQSQDMRFIQSVSSPLAGNGSQTLSVEQVNTFVDSVKSASPLGSALANPSGCIAVSVVWTCYALGLRFGISADISSTRIDAVGGTLANALNQLPGFNVSPPSPSVTWSYLVDNSPDAPGKWIQPSSLTAPLTVSFPGNAGFELVLTPVVDESSIQLQCQVQMAT